MQVRYPEHEIKGVWFIAGQSYLKERLDVAAFDEVVRAMPEHLRTPVESPLPSQWYPEDAAAHFLHAWLEVGARNDHARFATMVAEASEQGVGRFFRAISRLASSRFLLKQTPTIFKQLRRGPAGVTVEPRSEDVLLRYHHFPFLEDPIYATLFQAQLGALMHVTTGEIPPIEVRDHSSTSLAVSVRV